MKFGILIALLAVSVVAGGNLRNLLSPTQTQNRVETASFGTQANEEISFPSHGVDSGAQTSEKGSKILVLALFFLRSTSKIHKLIHVSLK